MKTIRRIVCMGLVMCMAWVAQSGAQDARTLAEQANKAFVSGKSAASKALYLKAAAMGSAEAHYWLAARFEMGQEERLDHFSLAAKGGLAKALTAALDILLFRADSLTRTDPQRALDLYNEVKKTNPDMKDGYYGEEGVRTMKMCAEPKGFDAARFMKKYSIEKEKAWTATPCPYCIWELAEEASRGGRFGKPDPELVFNLVIRGGSVPVELISAVEDTYKNWKKGAAGKFTLCDYVTSSMGQNYCAQRNEEEEGDKEDARVADLRAKLGKNSRTPFDRAYGAAVKFFEMRADHEECGRCGMGYTANILSSRAEQKDNYLTLVEKVWKKKWKPSPKDSLEAADQKLNRAYQDIMKKAGKHEGCTPCAPGQKELRNTQRRWIAYRDASARLFVLLNPAVNEKTWKAWLTEARQEELGSIELGE